MASLSCRAEDWLRILVRTLAAIALLLGVVALIFCLSPPLSAWLMLPNTSLREPSATIALVLCALGASGLRWLPIPWPLIGNALGVLLGSATLISLLDIRNHPLPGSLPSATDTTLLFSWFRVSTATALCFLMQGLSVHLATRQRWIAHAQTLRVLGHSIVISLSLACLLGAIDGFKGTTMWTLVFAMNPWIAAGFLALGLSEILLAWLDSPKGAYHVPGWAPSMAGIFLFAGTLFFWQAVVTRQANAWNQAMDETTLGWLILIIGSSVSALVTAVLFSAQMAKSKAVEAVASHRGLSEEMAERRRMAAALEEERNLLRTLIESLPQGICFKDLSLTYRMVNASFSRGLDRPPSSIIGKKDADLMPATMAENLGTDDRRAMSLRQQQTIEEIRLLPSGDRRVIEITKCPVIDEHDRVIGLLGLFTDTTERKNAEGRLQGFAAQLERSNRELQDFAYVASHDLQEPLRKVAIFGNRLLTKCGEQLSPEGCDYLERILNATKRMQTLINDLLSYSRASTQRHPFTTVNLTEIVREVAVDLEARIEETQAKMEIGQLPTIEADALHMRQLFQNLVGNALKFRQPNIPPCVRIQGLAVSHAEVLDAGPMTDFCQITVEDNGIGFEQKYAERIFHVFQRLHNRTQYEGSGVGLAICRKITERHGGAISVSSVPGQGTTFTVRLPLKQSTNHPL